MLNTTWNALARYIKVQRGKNILLLNSDTVGELLNSKGLVDELTKYAEQKKEKLGDDYIVETQKTKDRTRVLIVTANEKAVNDNLENNTLLKAVGK